MRLVALTTGFYKNNRIRTGEEFDFDPKPDGKLPKWAAEVTAEKPKAAKKLDADLKPKAAQAAVRTKFTGTDLV